MRQRLDSYTTASAALIAEEGGFRLSGSAPFDMASAAPSARERFALGTEPASPSGCPRTGSPNRPVRPATDVRGRGGRGRGGSRWRRRSPSALDTIRAIAAFALGVDLDADVLPLFDREVGISITGFDGELPGGQLLLRPDDPEAACERRSSASRTVCRRSAARRARGSRRGSRLRSLSPHSRDLRVCRDRREIIARFQSGERRRSPALRPTTRGLPRRDRYLPASVRGRRRACRGGGVRQRRGRRRPRRRSARPTGRRPRYPWPGSEPSRSPSHAGEDQIGLHAVLTIDDAASPIEPDHHHT